MQTILSLSTSIEQLLPRVIYFSFFFFIKIKMIGASNTAQDMCESITVLITIYGNVRPVSI